ncbi:Crossover junction endodeoxyribonuclease RuvC [Rickettsiales bacterium Ac37b]|nr:Crossover junction endodeoxyribonuclease RuvC [Rickettsiales bacterium Ac37b]
MTFILGIDPGLTRTGWGIISSNGQHISYIKSGTIIPPVVSDISIKLEFLYKSLTEVIQNHEIDECAIEESFVNKNASTSLKLGCARGAILLTLRLAGLEIKEYAAKLVKKTVTGVGNAEKVQVELMVKHLLPKAIVSSADEADALAIAICHSSFQRVKL